LVFKDFNLCDQAVKDVSQCTGENSGSVVGFFGLGGRK